MKLLIIEDNPADARLVREMLANASDIEIKHATSLTAGTKMLGNYVPDIVLLDLGLPESRGLETLKSFQSHAGNLPVLVMTSVDDEAMAIQAVQKGAQDYLVKGDIESKLLRRSLLYALERKRLQEAVLRSEKAQRESEENYRRIVETANEGILVTDTNAITLFVNARMAAMLGYTIEEMRGMEFYRLVGTEDIAASQKRLKERATGVSEQYETALVRKDGSEVWVIVSATPLFDQEQTYAGQLGMFADISERKKVDKLKDDFIGMVSHELKTPLTVVIGSLYTSRTPGLSKQDSDSLIHEAICGAESLADILENLLELSRFQARRLVLEKESTDIRKVAETIVRKLKSRADNHQLVLDIPANLSPAMVDQIRLERLLHNLVDNAIKYSPGGGEVRLFAHREGDRLVMGVQDHGTGISLEDQAKLFDRFQRLDKSGTGVPGVGLGLHVCRLLVEAHGGRIWIESEPGHGTTFRFTLPLAQTA